MLIRVASGHNRKRSTSNDSIGLHPYSATHRKGELIRLLIASYLCTAVGGQQFRKEWRKLQTRIMFKRYYSFFHYCLLSCRYVMFQKRILCKPKWGDAPHPPPSP